MAGDDEGGAEAVERQPVVKPDHRVGVALHPRERQEQNARTQALDDDRGGCGVVHGGLPLVTLQCHLLICSSGPVEWRASFLHCTVRDWE